VRVRRGAARVADPADGAEPVAGDGLTVRLPHDLRDTLAFSVVHDIVPRVTLIGLDGAQATLEAMAGATAHGRSVISFT
jgi:D-arabinose 1-dehydrogenase-like Zn-dependent alcohol dehydrogenase